MPRNKKIWILLGFFGILFIFCISLIAGFYFLTPKIETPISVLVMGKGGAGHDAPDLTDTMILATVAEDKVTLVSLPRDIWVPEIRAKLNSAYYWGKEKSEGYKLVNEAVGSITGVQPNHNLVIDFSIFKDLIDALEGIEVDVQNTFIDEKYPIAGKEDDSCILCRYETIKFEKGITTMNGETALKFVRSRNAEGDEGTDFAREARQQLVITAIKNKVSSSGVFLSPRKLLKIRKVVTQSIETDIPNSLFIPLLKKAYAARNNINSSVIPEDFLVNPPISRKYDNQYVLIPKSKNGSWDEMKEWYQKLID